MMYLKHLNNMGLSGDPDIDEIKHRYRQLAKTYHPDIYKIDNGECFRSATESYEFLLNNYASRPKIVVPKPKLKTEESFYRIVEDEKGFSLPYEVLPYNIVVHIIRGSREFTLSLPKDMSLPQRLKITNIGSPFELPIRYEQPKYK